MSTCSKKNHRKVRAQVMVKSPAGGRTTKGRSPKYKTEDKSESGIVNKKNSTSFKPEEKSSNSRGGSRGRGSEGGGTVHPGEGRAKPGSAAIAKGGNNDPRQLGRD